MDFLRASSLRGWVLRHSRWYAFAQSLQYLPDLLLGWSQRLHVCFGRAILNICETSSSLRSFLHITLRSVDGFT